MPLHHNFVPVFYEPPQDVMDRINSHVRDFGHFFDWHDRDRGVFNGTIAPEDYTQIVTDFENTSRVQLEWFELFQFL